MPTQEQGPLINACPECGEAIDVSDLPPYAKIACPHCKESIRVRTSLGQYHIQRLLGEGGMSQVFLALDETLGRSVALKVLHKELSRDEKLTASFEREAKLTASINHPNVVKVYTVGSDHGYFFIAMELVDNLSLEELITNQDRVAQLKVVQIAHDVTSGLYAAFKAGLIHRDIKPGNILLTNDGNAKLVDFGLAVQTGHHDEDEDVWATPFYVPPEKLAGEPDDFRGDIYSLGATLFHAVSGTPPYAANTASLDELKKIKAKTIRLIETVPDARKRTCRLIDRMMARKPGDRHQNYKDLLEEIIEVENKLGSRRRPGSAISSAPHSEEVKKPLWIKPAVAAGLALVLIAVLAFVFRGSKDDDLNATLLSGGNDRVLVAGEQNTAARYVEARNLLGEGKVSQAQKLFQIISKAEDLKEPTRTWTEFNLGLCLLLQSNEKGARTAFLKLSQANKKPDVDESVSALIEFFSHTGATLNDVLPVRNNVTVLSDNGGSHEGIAYLAFGLKNWNQGQFDSALRFFKQFQASAFPEPYTWVESLKKQIANYQQDGKILKGLPNPHISMSNGELGKIENQLIQARKNLSTSGSAPRLLDDRIERSKTLIIEKKRLASLPKTTPPPLAPAAAPTAVAAAVPMSPGPVNAAPQPNDRGAAIDAKSMAELKKLWTVEEVALGLGSNFEFPQALSRFEMVQAETPLARELLADEMQIVKRAESFLGRLIGRLNEGKYEGEVLRKEGKSLTAKITGATRSTIIVDLGFGGNEVVLEEFSPKWLLNLAGDLFGDGAEENPELLGDAVCFAWATEEHDLARKLAKQGKNHPDEFVAMWKRMMKNRPRD